MKLCNTIHSSLNDTAIHARKLQMFNILILLYVRDENLLYINNGQQIDCHSHGLPSDRRWSISADLVQARFTQIGPRSVSELESVLTLQFWVTTVHVYKLHLLIYSVLTSTWLIIY